LNLVCDRLHLEAIVPGGDQLVGAAEMSELGGTLKGSGFRYPHQDWIGKREEQGPHGCDPHYSPLSIALVWLAETAGFLFGGAGPPASPQVGGKADGPQDIGSVADASEAAWC
jgi:hypothetical protein